MNSRDYTNPNVFFFDITDDNLFNGGSIQEDTPICEESIERRETPSVDVQILRIGGNVNTRLSTGGHDMVPTTTVPILRIFDRFRNMRLNSLGSNYTSHADNRYHAGDQQIRTRTLENAGYPSITDEVSVPNVHKRGCVHNVSTTSLLEESIQINTIRTQVMSDILGHKDTPISEERGHDMVPTTTVPVSRIFDRFRNMCLNSHGSDYMSHTDNRFTLHQLRCILQMGTTVTDVSSYMERLEEIEAKVKDERTKIYVVVIIADFVAAGNLFGCMVGREKHSAFCIMQKCVDLKSIGTRLQIVSAFDVEHVKGFSLEGDTPIPPKPPIDKAYSIASIKAFHQPSCAPSTTYPRSTVDPLHDTNDSLVKSLDAMHHLIPKLVEMIVDVDSTAHGSVERPELYNPYVPSPQAQPDIHITVIFQLAQLLAGPSVSFSPTISAPKQHQYGLSGPPGFRHAPIEDYAPLQASHQPQSYHHAFETMTLQEPLRLNIEYWGILSPCREHILRRLCSRCDSTGDLYPVTQQPSTTSTFALLTLSPTTWHRRLGHPSDDVLRRLESSHFISCNKSKLSALCHACQLGKHTKLPFYSSVSHVASVFDIVHSDLWTSPISSESGIKYYAIFLDHFSHYVWVYPLLHKSDLFDTFVTFRAYVNQQFNVDIKALQCDHGGEFDNTPMGALPRAFFATWHPVSVSLVPKPPNKIGNRTDVTYPNNITRTLLFSTQTHLVLVEALNMAAHLLNILPSSAINNEIPFTKLYNKPPTYDHLRTGWFSNGRSQQQGIDCNETFSLVYKPATIRTVLKSMLCVTRDWPIHQLQCEECLLLPWPVYLRQSICIATLVLWDTTHPDYVCHLQRSLYGLKQAPRAWFQRFTSFITRVGFQHSKTDASLFVFHRGSDIAYLLLIVGVGNSERAYMPTLQPLVNPLLTTESKLGSDGDAYCVIGKFAIRAACPSTTANLGAIFDECFSAVETMMPPFRFCVLHIPSRFQYTNIFTKGLPSALFCDFRSSLNVRRSPVLTAGEY
ncbi:ribonuclease H-like domain-containing protein [Tanacetum coccineum]|uniref:Ribonuclease H-like domain-containing protein n=1 Tax=Tanacetum coccineum TaxID=301880 RepID=A0ABQ4X4I3_9ASTR